MLLNNTVICEDLAVCVIHGKMIMELGGMIQGKPHSIWRTVSPCPLQIPHGSNPDFFSTRQANSYLRHDMAFVSVSCTSLKKKISGALFVIRFIE
jgi:hypothetical protein